MKTISIINLKGGVGKTVSAVSMAHILSTTHNKRVLLIDNDKQGNISKMFGLHSYDDMSITDVLTGRHGNVAEIIAHTRYANLDVIPSNMTLLEANAIERGQNKQTRLKAALDSVAGNYDYCIIDNAPDLNMSTINALVASEDVLIPIKIDKFAFDGLTEIIEQIDNIQRGGLNPKLTLRGCFITLYQNNEVNRQGEEWLRGQGKYSIFRTHIRRTEKVDESTFARTPIREYSPRSGAARDYLSLVTEYLAVSDSDA